MGGGLMTYSLGGECDGGNSMEGALVFRGLQRGALDVGFRFGFGIIDWHSGF